MRSFGLGSSVALALAFLIPACGNERDEMTEARSTARVLNVEPQAVIGEVEGDPNYLFGDIRAVAVDDSGRVYVGDRIGATVRVFSAEGAFLTQIAREGEGPGEIQGWPADLTVGPEGDLYVRDASRITVFSARGGHGIPDSVSAIWRMPGYGNTTFARGRVGDDGRYYFPNSIHRIGEPFRFFFQIFRNGLPESDTLAVPHFEGMGARRTAFYRLGPSDGRMVDGLSHVPFAPIPTWTVTERGTVLSTDGSGNRLLETNAAQDTVRVIALPDPPRRTIPSRERADSLRALEARIDSLPVRIEEVVNLGLGVAERELPDLLPSLLSLHSGADGSLWVERWPEEGMADSRTYDVINLSGVLLASVRLQAPLVSEPQPYFGRHAIVGVVVDPETEVQEVVVFPWNGIAGRK